MMKAAEAVASSWLASNNLKTTDRDIRQWAISQAAHHNATTDEILKTAARYVDFVEALAPGRSVSRGDPHAPQSIFRLFAADIDGTYRYLVADPYRGENGNLSHSKEVAQVYPTNDAAQMALRARPMIDGRELSIGEYSE